MKLPANISKGSHKKAAVTFEQLIVDGQISEAYEKYLGPDFRHHNPYSRTETVCFNQSRHTRLGQQ